MNLVPRLDPDDRAAALYHGLADVASDSVGAAALPARPAAGTPPSRHGSPLWFRQFIEVRDAEGAERARLGGSRGASPSELADMLFAAATDHRYLDGGHTLDFVNKALEALDVAGWERAEAVLASLPAQLAGAERMEEANAWRNPVDIVGAAGGASTSSAPRGRGRREPPAAGTAAALVTPCSSTASRPAIEALLDAFATARRRWSSPRRSVRRRDADRPLPHQQRVRRLGHGAAHVHVRERRRAGPRRSPSPSFCAACSTRQ